MTTKEPSRRQIIIPMSKLKLITLFNSHITNLNKVLKNTKSDIIVDFVQSDLHGLIITINKVTSLLDLYTIENYVKNANNINIDNILTSQLFQSNSYLIIIGISYLMENTNMLINSSVVETILKIYIYSIIYLLLPSHELSKCYLN